MRLQVELKLDVGAQILANTVLAFLSMVIV